MAGLAQGDQVAGAAGVAAQEGREHGLGEHAGGAGLDVGLHTQLDRLGRAGEQRRKALLELLGALGGALAGIVIAVSSYGWLCAIMALPVLYLGAKAWRLRATSK